MKLFWQACMGFPKKKYTVYTPELSLLLMVTMKKMIKIVSVLKERSFLPKQNHLEGFKLPSSFTDTCCTLTRAPPPWDIISWFTSLNLILSSSVNILHNTGTREMEGGGKYFVNCGEYFRKIFFMFFYLELFVIFALTKNVQWQLKHYRINVVLEFFLLINEISHCLEIQNPWRHFIISR